MRSEHTGSEVADHGQFPYVNVKWQPCRHKRGSGDKRFSAEPGDSLGNRRGSPENTKMVLAGLHRCFLDNFSVLRRMKPVIHSTYRADGEATHGIPGYTAAGHYGNTGIGVRDGRQACTAHNLDKLAAYRAAARARESRVLLPAARNTTTRKLDRLRAALERRVPPRSCRNTSRTRRAASWSASRKREGTSGCPLGNTRYDTYLTVTVGGGCSCAGHSRSRR